MNCQRKYTPCKEVMALMRDEVQNWAFSPDPGFSSRARGSECAEKGESVPDRRPLFSADPCGEIQINAKEVAYEKPGEMGSFRDHEEMGSL